MKHKQLQELQLADFITLMGMGAAMGSIFFAFNGSFYWAYALLLAQFVLDAIDGRVARKLGPGQLGIYLDSFSDFTAITAVVILGWNMGIETLWIFISGFLFMAAAAIRLSYFTMRAHQGKKDFIGIPTVLCVVILATTLIVNDYFTGVDINVFAALYAICAYLMISNIKLKKI